MRNLFNTFVIITVFLITVISCEEVAEVLSTDGGDDEIVTGLKKALEVGTDTAINLTNITDGYFDNPVAPMIKILLPPEAELLEKFIAEVPVPGLGQVLIDQFILTINRAAEDASEKATPIFKKAIINMTIVDGMNILMGGDSVAATNYLKKETTDELFTNFYPDVNTSLKKVGADAAWDAITTPYNTYIQTTIGKGLAEFGGYSTDTLPADISEYATEKAIDGLFVIVAKEEEKIRKDPLHRVTEILQKVFGKLD